MSTKTTATTVEDLHIQDFLIIGLGDSYASGEGNPNVEVTPQNYINFDNAQKVLTDALKVQVMQFADARGQGSRVDLH